MKFTVEERADQNHRVLYGDQIVGVIRHEHRLGRIFHAWVSSWDYFNPKHVQQLKSMVNDKLTLLNITKRLQG